MNELSWLPVIFWLGTFASAGIAVMLASVIRTRASLLLSLAIYLAIGFLAPAIIAPTILGVEDTPLEMASWYLLIAGFRVLELEGLKLRRVFVGLWKETAVQQRT